MNKHILYESILMNPKIMIHICQTKDDFEIAKQITTDYMNWLNMDLCFQNVEAEFERFEKIYKYPKGCYVFALTDKCIAGGGGFREFDKNICEMKRLYVYDQFRNFGVGRKLCEDLIDMARSCNYEKMRLDTVAKLKDAIKLYEKLGFKEISAYYDNPDPSVKYMEFEL